MSSLKIDVLEPIIFLVSLFKAFILPSRVKWVCGCFAHIDNLYPSTYSKLFNLSIIIWSIFSVPFNSILPIVLPSEL